MYGDIYTSSCLGTHNQSGQSDRGMVYEILDFHGGDCGG
jgi:hypothetical protein